MRRDQGNPSYPLFSPTDPILPRDLDADDEVASATGWQRHTVRGFFSGTLKKLGLTLASAKEERGRVYRMKPPIHDLSPVPGRGGNRTNRPGNADAAEGWTTKSPYWWIGRRTNCGLPGGNCIAPDRLWGSGAIC